MKIQILALIAGNALLVSTGGIMMRYGGRSLDWSQGLGVLRNGKLWLAGMFICWVAGLVFALLLTKHEFLTVYMPYVVLNFVLVVLGGHFLLGEHFGLAKYIGAVLALLGIYLMLRGDSA